MERKEEPAVKTICTSLNKFFGDSLNVGNSLLDKDETRVENSIDLGTAIDRSVVMSLQKPPPISDLPNQVNGFNDLVTSITSMDKRPDYGTAIERTDILLSQKPALVSDSLHENHGIDNLEAIRKGHMLNTKLPHRAAKRSYPKTVKNDFIFVGKKRKKSNLKRVKNKKLSKIWENRWKSSNTPLKYKNYHHNFFNLCRKRKRT